MESRLEVRRDSRLRLSARSEAPVSWRFTASAKPQAAYSLISASAFASVSMSSAVLNGPGLTRTAPSGNVPMARWMYGAQCRPGRIAMSKA